MAKSDPTDHSRRPTSIRRSPGQVAAPAVRRPAPGGIQAKGIPTVAAATTGTCSGPPVYRPLQRRVATPVAFSSVQRKPNTAIQRKSAATPSPTIARTRPVHIPPVYRPQSVLLPRSADANATSRRRANQTVPPPLLTRPVQFSRAGAIQRALTPTGQNYLN